MEIKAVDKGFRVFLSEEIRKQAGIDAGTFIGLEYDAKNNRITLTPMVMTPAQPKAADATPSK